MGRKDAELRPQRQNPQPTETAPLTEPPIYITENSPEVIKAYKLQYPNREIIVLPPDDVAKGFNLEDDMPLAPRRPT